MRMPTYPVGVPSQFKTHVHPWPTRYHGPIYTRPVFGFPYVQSPHAVFKPGDFSATATAGLGADELFSTMSKGQVAVTFTVLGAASLWLISSWLYEHKRKS